ncbi:MAG: TrkH family potassium uptake protein [Atribacterota bacterium]|nr:TrkH family potassium uptake protein [Atribacterota bacterium]
MKTKSGHPLFKKKKELTPNQILVLGFLGIISIGTYLLQHPISSSSGISIELLDALFTATSATCVTGLIVLDTGKDFSLFGQWVILILFQIGGLGIMTFSTMFAFLLGRKISLRQRLLIQESLNQFSIGGLVRLAKYIIVFTIFFEGLGTLLLYINWSNLTSVHNHLFLSFFHAVSAFCNAGFSLFSDSLEQFNLNIGINLIFLILIVFGGIGFLVLVELFEFPKKHRLSLHSKLVLVVTIVLLITGAVGIYLLEKNNSATLQPMLLKGRILTSLFQSTTARTAGFNTISVEQLGNSTLFFLIILMFIGASPTSTGGGIKTTTFSIAFLWMYYTLKGRRHLYLFCRQISSTIMNKAWAILMLSLSWTLMMTLLISYYEKFDFIELFFEIISAFGTVGLSTGITSQLSPAGKIIIILTMFLGRLGPLSLALSLIINRHPESIQYPEGHIMVG